MLNCSETVHKRPYSYTVITLIFSNVIPNANEPGGEPLKIKSYPIKKSHYKNNIKFLINKTKRVHPGQLTGLFPGQLDGMYSYRSDPVNGSDRTY